MEYVEEVDDAVLEYLVFRGFVDSASAMLSEQSEGNGIKGGGSGGRNGSNSEQHLMGMGLGATNAERVSGALVELAQRGDLERLLELWHFLEVRLGLLCGPLGSELVESAAQLKSGLLRLFLVSAKKNGSTRLILHFLEWRVFESEGLDANDWRAWCALPFCVAPEEDALFAPFFRDEWLKLFALSLNNFVSQVFCHQRAPKLLAFPLGRRHEEAQAAELKAKEFECVWLREEIERLKIMLVNRDLVKASLATLREVTPQADDATLGANQKFKKIGAAIDADTPGGATLSPFATGRHAAKVNKCCFAPGSTILATASSDSTVRLWTWDRALTARSSDDNTTATPLVQDQVIFCPSQALSLAWIGKNTELLATGTASSIVKLWDVDKRTEVGQIVVTGEAHLPFVVDLRFCSRKSMFVTVNTGQGNAAVNTTGGTGTGKLKLQHQQQSLTSLLSPQVTVRSQMCLWSTTTLQLVRSFEPEGFHISTATFNHNGSLIVTGSMDGRVRVFDVLKGTSIMQWSVSATEASVTNICLTSDETGVISITDDGIVAVWSLHRINEALCTFPTQATTEPAFHASPNDMLRYGNLVLNNDSNPEQLLASCPTFGSNIGRFDFRKPSRASMATQHTKVVTSLDWAPGQSLLCTASLDKTIQLYNHPLFS